MTTVTARRYDVAKRTDTKPRWEHVSLVVVSGASTSGPGNLDLGHATSHCSRVASAVRDTSKTVSATLNLPWVSKS